MSDAIAMSLNELAKIVGETSRDVEALKRDVARLKEDALITQGKAKRIGYTIVVENENERVEKGVVGDSEPDASWDDPDRWVPTETTLADAIKASSGAVDIGFVEPIPMQRGGFYATSTPATKPATKPEHMDEDTWLVMQEIRVRPSDKGPMTTAPTKAVAAIIRDLHAAEAEAAGLRRELEERPAVRWVPTDTDFIVLKSMHRKYEQELELEGPSSHQELLRAWIAKCQPAQPATVEPVVIVKPWVPTDEQIRKLADNWRCQWADEDLFALDVRKWAESCQPAPAPPVERLDRKGLRDIIRLACDDWDGTGGSAELTNHIMRRIPAQPATVPSEAWLRKAAAAEDAAGSVSAGCQPATVAPEQPVLFYGSEFYVLSNFSSFRLNWGGVDFDTSEHAYHCEKFPTRPDIKNEIMNARSAHDAFKIAESWTPLRRYDWNEIRESIMYGILFAKAEQHEYVKRKLLQTGDRELIEDSWRDSFWGWGSDRKGQNMLGKLWMRIRSELQAITPAP